MKKIKFYRKNCKNWSYYNFNNHSINSKNYATAYHQTLEEFARTLVPEKTIKIQIQKLERISNFAHIKIMKNIPLHLEAMHSPIIKP